MLLRTLPRPRAYTYLELMCPYFPGSIGCVCCLLWFTVIYDDPMHHPCISAREKEHIVSSLAQQVPCPPPPVGHGEVPGQVWASR